MLTINHVLTGALIAHVVGQPAAAIMIAFASHFILDMLPHYGIPLRYDDAQKRQMLPLFTRVAFVDTALMLVLLIVVPVWWHGPSNPWLILACMVAAVLPDVVWAIRYIKQLKTKVFGPRGWFAGFHKRIQWGESKWGISVDIAWFIASIAILIRIGT